MKKGKYELSEESKKAMMTFVDSQFPLSADMRQEESLARIAMQVSWKACDE